MPRTAALSAILLVFVMLFMMIPLGPASGADGGACDGAGHGVGRLRLEGECYVQPAAKCDPAARDATRVVVDASASAGAYVRMPSNGCGAVWSMGFPALARIDRLRVLLPDHVGEQLTVWVDVDGHPAASGIVVGNARGGFRPVNLVSTVDVAPGVHSIVVEFRVDSGGSWTDLRLDAIEAALVGVCANDAPEPPIYLGNDGMGNGTVGWAGSPYTFDAEPDIDADGDPLTLRWIWADGSAQGAPADLTFTSLGAGNVMLRASDDPSGRSPCTATDALSSSLLIPFFVLGDLVPSWERPLAGETCVEDHLVGSPDGAPDLIVGRCTTRASVGLPPDVPALPIRADFRYDESPFANATGSFQALYESLPQRFGDHELDACMSVPGDRHARSFCTAPHPFFNVGGL